MTEELLRIAFAEIVIGSTPSLQKDHGVFYIKHATHLELSKNYQFYKKIYDLAVERELPTNEEREKQIIEDGSWTEAKDKRIKELASFIANLKQTKSKLFQQAEKDAIEKQIYSSQSEHDELALTKQMLVGSTAESFALRKLNEHFIFNSIYKNEKCSVKLFSQDQYDELDEHLIMEFINLCSKAVEKFTSKAIKKIALSPFFMIGFSICADNPQIFYGKPVVSLTANQIELFSSGINFKNIIQNNHGKIPEEVISDPDRLIDWVNKTSVIKEVAEAADQNLSKNTDRDSVTGSMSIVGASKEDLKNIGITEDIGMDFAKEAASKGGMLTFEDIIRIQNSKKV